MEPIKDRELVMAARRGDRDAFEQLVKRHEKKAYAVALGIVRDPDDARDACQESFLRVYRHLDSFDGEAQFSTWLYRIVVNLCLDLLRRRRTHAAPFADAEQAALVEERVLAVDADEDRSIERKQLAARLHVALEQLSPIHRSVLVLREVQGLSYQEIADAVGCSIGTVMSRLFHARRRMRALLVDEHAELAMAA